MLAVCGLQCIPYYENVLAELGLVGVRLLLRIWREEQTAETVQRTVHVGTVVTYVQCHALFDDVSWQCIPGPICVFDVQLYMHLYTYTYHSYLPTYCERTPCTHHIAHTQCNTHNTHHTHTLTTYTPTRTFTHLNSGTP